MMLAKLQNVVFGLVMNQPTIQHFNKMLQQEQKTVAKHLQKQFQALHLESIIMLEAGLINNVQVFWKWLY